MSAQHPIALEKDLAVSRPVLYGKLNGMELGISQALVLHSASNLESLICQLKVNQTKLLAGYEMKIALRQSFESNRASIKSWEK